MPRFVAIGAHRRVRGRADELELDVEDDGDAQL